MTFAVISSTSSVAQTTTLMSGDLGSEVTSSMACRGWARLALWPPLQLPRV
ncbi:hypothetical protein GW17_00051107 [Ensete ventricosum]|nr:hypothetical protein GW17_00051107 [Ensete ventricosum]